MTTPTAARRPSDDRAAEYARAHSNAPYTLSGLEAVERRSVALHAARHPLEGQSFTPCPRCDGRNYGGVNLGLTNMCQASHHDLCAGQVVVTAPGAPWSCGCLCHHARDREREA